MFKDLIYVGHTPWIWLLTLRWTSSGVSFRANIGTSWLSNLTDFIPLFLIFKQWIIIVKFKIIIQSSNPWYNNNISLFNWCYQRQWSISCVSFKRTPLGLYSKSYVQWEEFYYIPQFIIVSYPYTGD